MTDLKEDNYFILKYYKLFKIVVPLLEALKEQILDGLINSNKLYKFL